MSCNDFERITFGGSRRFPGLLAALSDVYYIVNHIVMIEPVGPGAEVARLIAESQKSSARNHSHKKSNSFEFQKQGESSAPCAAYA